MEAHEESIHHPTQEPAKITPASAFPGIPMRSHSPMEEKKAQHHHATVQHAAFPSSMQQQPVYHVQPPSVTLPSQNRPLPSNSSGSYPGLMSGGSADNLLDNFPPPLPIPASSHLMSGASLPSGSYSSAGSSESLISQLVGVSAIHGQIDRSNSRGAVNLGHGKKRVSPEKALHVRVEVQ